MNNGARSTFKMLKTGAEGLAAMRDAIQKASRTVRLETYIFRDSPVGRGIRDALVQACRRGVEVRVLIDALGSVELPDSLWTPLRDAGGRVRWFNPLSLKRWSYRDHRKLLACDEREAIVGGFNISQEYAGDGVSSGWRDLGLQAEGGAAAELAHSFDRIFDLAEFRHRRLQRLRKASDRVVEGENWRLVSSGPGCRHGEIKRSLARDLSGAGRVRIATAYFLPTRGLRRELRRAARRGTRVQLMLAGKTDVALSQLAGRHLYRSLLRAGVEIYEYQPQIFHPKLIVAGNTVYAGSANLDTRSLQINYELLMRVEDEHLAREAAAIFDSDLQHCRRIEGKAWRRARSWWGKFKERGAYLLLSKLDLLVARWQLKALR